MHWYIKVFSEGSTNTKKHSRLQLLLRVDLPAIQMPDFFSGRKERIKSVVYKQKPNSLFKLAVRNTHSDKSLFLQVFPATFARHNGQRLASWH